MKKCIILLLGAMFFWHTTYSQSWDVNGNHIGGQPFFIGTIDKEPLRFFTENKQRMTITPYSGFVGMGITNPNNQLHIHSDDKRRYFYEGYMGTYSEYPGDSEGPTHPTDPGGGEGGGVILTGGKLEENTEDGLVTQAIASPRYYSGLQITNIATGNTSHNGLLLHLYDKSAFLRQLEEAPFSIAMREHDVITITPDEKVGIGTSNPQYKLDVQGDIASTGNIKLNGSLSVNETNNGVYIGDAYGTALDYGTAYLGFNAKRTGSSWQVYSDGAHNGGAVIWATIGGDIFFSTIAAQASTNYQTVSDNTIKNNIKMRIGSDGIVKAKEIQITLTGWPDYVFAKEYKLMSLPELEQYIQKHNHLPDVPLASEVEEDGVKIGEMNAILLQKIEEMTLYIINLEKRITDMENKKGGE